MYLIMGKVLVTASFRAFSTGVKSVSLKKYRKYSKGVIILLESCVALTHFWKNKQSIVNTFFGRESTF